MPVLTTKQAFLFICSDTMRIIFFYIVLIFLTSPATAQSGRYISLHQKTELLEQHKKISSSLELYFDKEKTILTKHIIEPEELVIVSNSD